MLLSKFYSFLHLGPPHFLLVIFKSRFLFLAQNGNCFSFTFLTIFGTAQNDCILISYLAAFLNSFLIPVDSYEEVDYSSNGVRKLCVWWARGGWYRRFMLDTPISGVFRHIPK